MWTVPDKGEGFNDIQSILFQEYLDALVAGIAGTEVVLAGCAVTAQGSPNMTLAVAKGAVLAQGTLRAVTAGNVTIGAADATNPRIDLVVVDSSGVKQVRAGTAAAAPKPPARTAGDVALAAVYVPANDTTIENDKITSMRVVRGGGTGGGGAPLMLAKSTTAATISNASTEQVVYSLSIPSGLFLAGQIIRVRIGGNYLSNSGTPTWTWRIKYGGTTMFQDVTAATAADVDRGAWYIEFEIAAQANNDQHLSGNVSFQTPGAKTAPAVGIGDLAVTTHVNAPIAGAAAVDSDAADRLLEITVQMSVANANVQTVREFVMVELA